MPRIDGSEPPLWKMVVFALAVGVGGVATVLVAVVVDTFLLRPTLGYGSAGILFIRLVPLFAYFAWLLDRTKQDTEARGLNE